MKINPANADDIPSEVADIFRGYGEEYRSQNAMTKKQHSVMSAIQGCRTGDFGYHVDQCDNCGYSESHFNSCRDRHCPKCQAVSKHKWVAARLKDTLPVAYFHIVFTLPHALNGLTQYNKQMVYDLLMASSSQTLLTFGRDPKWLGGKIGFYGILHTWGQRLWLHPHVHYIVAGGALSADGHWIEPKYKNKFFSRKGAFQSFSGQIHRGIEGCLLSEKIGYL